MAPHILLISVSMVVSVGTPSANVGVGPSIILSSVSFPPTPPSLANPAAVRPPPAINQSFTLRQLFPIRRRTKSSRNRQEERRKGEPVASVAEAIASLRCSTMWRELGESLRRLGEKPFDSSSRYAVHEDDREFIDRR